MRRRHTRLTCTHLTTMVVELPGFPPRMRQLHIGGRRFSPDTQASL